MEEYLKKKLQFDRMQVTDILDVSDVALLIKRTESRIRHLCKDRLIPHYKDERTGELHFLKSEIEAWRLGTKVATAAELSSVAATHTVLNPRKQ